MSNNNNNNNHTTNKIMSNNRKNNNNKNKKKIFVIGMITIMVILVVAVVAMMIQQFKFLNPIMKWEITSTSSHQNCNYEHLLRKKKELNEEEEEEESNDNNILSTKTKTKTAIITTSSSDEDNPPLQPLLSPPTKSKFMKICNTVTSKPLAQIWRKQMLPNLFSKLFPINGDGGNTVRTNETIRDWYTLALNETYSFHDWKKTILHPPDMEGMGLILELLERKLKDPTNDTIPPIRVAVYGGSVTKGTAASKSHHFPNYKEDNKCWPTRGAHCGWVLMLQEASDQILGPGIVSMTNFGAGGAKTPYSTNLMEMGVWPETYPMGVTADIIIWSHGVNDATHHDMDGQTNKRLGDFHLAARRTRCDDGLPMIVYLNDLGGHGFEFDQPSSQFMKLAGGLNEITSWFGVMGIHVARLWTAYNFANSDPSTAATSSSAGLPLIDLKRGEGFGEKHGGLMLHATIAYAIIFNFLSASADICEVEQELLPTPEQRRKKDPSREFSLPLPKSNMPPLNDDVSRANLIQQWKQSVVDYEERCGRRNNNNSTSLSSSSMMVDDKQSSATPTTSSGSRSVCAYSWLISHPVGNTKLRNAVRSSQGIQTVMDSILIDNDGWTSDKLHDKDKHIGWNANKTGATFTVAIKAESPATRYLRIVTMESYSDAWVNASVKLTISSSVNDIGDDKSKTRTTSSSTTSSSSVVTHFISGYNNRDKTSPIVPHKLDLPHVGNANDNIVMRFDLVSGRTFKIVAMALCEA